MTLPAADTPPAADASSAPRLSLILVCYHGRGDLLLPLPGLQAQTIAGEIELLLVARPGLFAPGEVEAITGLHSVRLVTVADPVPRGRAAAAAVPAATAPFIGLHENHTRAEPETYERILAAMPEGLAAIAPTFYCANAEAPWASAVFALAHGHCGASIDPGARDHLVHHHAVYPAVFLRAHAEELEHENRLQARVVREGGELRFQPETVLWHIEAASPRMGLWIAFILGRQFGWSRSRGWSAPQRLGRALLLPAIMAVSVLRLLKDLRRLQDSRPYVGQAALPVALMGVTFALGEVRGTFHRSNPWPDAVELHEFEVFERLDGRPPALGLLAQALGQRDLPGQVARSAA